LGKSQARALESRVGVLLIHLLKWQAQAELRSGSWNASITEQRRRIRSLLLRHPSLRPRLPQMVDSTYSRAKVVAAAETGLSLQLFSVKCPFTVIEIIDPDFWPE
jgi:Domain of unknown function DUF29